MEAKNLRLGNLILNKNGEVERVRTLYNKSINGYDGNAGIQPDDEDDFNPIPITKEWLLKLGFELDHEYGVAEKEEEKFYIITNSASGYFLGEYMPAEDHFIARFQSIKYVHQLQNLFFALTGKELELKE
jgi:hypothetical protein